MVPCGLGGHGNGVRRRGIRNDSGSVHHGSWPKNGAAAVVLCTPQGEVEDPNRESPSPAHSHGSNECAGRDFFPGNQYEMGDGLHKGSLEGRQS